MDDGFVCEHLATIILRLINFLLACIFYRPLQSVDNAGAAIFIASGSKVWPSVQLISTSPGQRFINIQRLRPFAGTLQKAPRHVINRHHDL